MLFIVKLSCIFVIFQKLLIVWTYHTLKSKETSRVIPKFMQKIAKLVIAHEFCTLLPFSLCFCCYHIYVCVCVWLLHSLKKWKDSLVTRVDPNYTRTHSSLQGIKM